MQLVQVFAIVDRRAVPTCSASKKQKTVKWFGRVTQNQNDKNDCSIVMCEECYTEFKDTSLEPYFGDLTTAIYPDDEPQKEVFCGPWSKRSNAVLTQAAEANDFTILARHWNHREMVRTQTLPLMKAYIEQDTKQNMLKRQAHENASIGQSCAGVLEAVSGPNYYKYGNNSVSFDNLGE